MKRKMRRRAGRAAFYPALCCALCFMLFAAALRSAPGRAAAVAALGSSLPLFTSAAKAEPQAEAEAEPPAPPAAQAEAPAAKTENAPREHYHNTPEPEPQPEPSESTEAPEEPEKSALPELPEAQRQIGAEEIELTNSTSFEPDIAALLAREPELTGRRILIIHTHSSESYTPEADGLYEESDYFRTEEREYSVVRVGDELAAAFEELGLEVLHERSIYDYPSYTGSYSRTMEAVSAYLEKYPDIGIVIDLHRDALSLPDGTPYATGKDGCAQVMLVIGTGESGLYHPNWEENLCLAAQLQRAMLERSPGLCRPIALSRSRYNQQLSPGYFILEVGSTGNTLSEALEAARRFAVCAADVIKSLDS